MNILKSAYEGESYNGSKYAAIIIGYNNKITLRNVVPNADQDLKNNIGVNNNTIGLLAKDQNYSASNIIIHNHSSYPLVFDDNSKNC